jgi:hypothetical protein
MRSLLSLSHSSIAGLDAMLAGQPSAVDTLDSALDMLAALPSSLSAAHGALEMSLRERGDGVRRLVADYLKTGREVASTAKSVSE